MKKISILLTNKNQGDKLFFCMKSLIKQTYPNLEILVLDAGYKSEGIHYVRELQFYNSNIFIYEKKYASLNALRKLGLEKATGEYVLFMMPEDTLNLNTITVLVDCIEKENADIAIGGFHHPYYTHYLNNFSYDLTNSEDFGLYQTDIFSTSMLSGKLYKKELFKEVKFKDVFLNETIINLQILLKAKKIITTEKMLFTTKEHISLFENNRFWENKQSFWNKTYGVLDYQAKFFKAYKKQYPNVNEKEIIKLHSLEYLLWELLVYAHFASLESLTIELYQILKNERIVSLWDDLSSFGLAWKDTDMDTFLANCILYADLLSKKVINLQKELSQINIIKICIMILLKLFCRQTTSLNTQNFLCRIREELNLNETREAKYVNSLRL